MNVWQTRRAAKTNVSLGKWRAGPMSRNSFPLSKAGRRFYRLGKAYTWRVITFQAGGYDYRLLVAYRTDKEQFSAMLGVSDVTGDTKIVARLEFHGTHGSWHLHYAAESMEAIPAGVRCGSWIKKHDCVAKNTYGLSHGSDDDAQRKAMTILADVFRLRSEESML